MRQDMYEVIIERPRYGGKARRGRRARDADALPIRESMRRTYVVQRAEKEIADNLAPFRRYLIRQVGRPWNKVYSRNLRSCALRQHRSEALARSHPGLCLARSRAGPKWTTARSLGIHLHGPPLRSPSHGPPVPSDAEKEVTTLSPARSPGTTPSVQLRLREIFGSGAQARPRHAAVRGCRCLRSPRSRCAPARPWLR